MEFTWQDAGLCGPFVGLILAMAVGPLIFPRGWERHHAVGALGFGLFAVLVQVTRPAGVETLSGLAREYFSFIALLASLHVIAGGICLRVAGESSPGQNVVYLFGGALLANVVGTMGASMILIRPWLRLNSRRAGAYPAVFFIFIVANIGGALTPIGDPPLLLGYLKGVPFDWVARHCWPMWATAIALLLAIFHILDRRQVRGAPPAAGWKLEGGTNLFLLAVIPIALLFVPSGYFLREGVMLGAAGVSWMTTRREVRAANSFRFGPLGDLVILFAALFATMGPAQEWLLRRVGGVPSAGGVYWSSGLLSSVLDNAPTYSSFFTILFRATAVGPSDLADGALRLAALSVGSVFFGACSYIGNGPNLLVQAMAREEGVPMPGFLGYIGRFSLPFLFPVLGLVWLIFFRQ